MEKTRTVISLVIIGFFGWWVFSYLQPRAEEVPPNIFLKNEVNRVLDGTTGKYSIAYKNLKTNEEFLMGEDEVYESGSLYKLWVMARTYEAISYGDFKESDQLPANIARLNNVFGLSSEEAEMQSGVISFTVGSALRQMITISHNYAALALTDKVKISSIQNWLLNNKFDKSKVGEDENYPQTTAKEMLIFYEKLYKGDLGTPENTQKMLDHLKAQQLNDKLPKGLPEGTVIAHKTGEIGNFSHDAGVVYTPNGDYVIVVLSDTKIPAAAEERIAAISKVFYDHVTTQSD